MTSSAPASAVDIGAIREIVAEHIGVSFDAQNFEAERDLYAAGLTSLATVSLMLGLEERFDIEFPESMLGRGTFRSLSAIAQAVGKLVR
jgi:acyl carrier protein